MTLIAGAVGGIVGALVVMEVQFRVSMWRYSRSLKERDEQEQS